MTSTLPFVSVIIPVFNDAERLKICLQALEQQTYPQQFYEVIVVDNASDSEQNISGVVAEFARSIAAYESVPGSYAARNKGIALAKGDVIAFTDADCIPAADWLEAGVACLQENRCGLVAGKISIFFEDDRQITPVELYESITAFPQQKLLELRHFGATANLFTFRQVIAAVGGFDADLKSGGDIEWGQRVFNRGYKQVYSDAAVVRHPARRSFKQLYRRTIRLVGGAHDLQRQQTSSFLKQNLEFAKDLAFDLVPPLMFVVNVFLDARLPNLQQKLSVSLVMFCVRYISAWERLRLKAGAASARE